MISRTGSQLGSERLYTGNHIYEDDDELAELPKVELRGPVDQPPEVVKKEVG